MSISGVMERLTRVMEVDVGSRGMAGGSRG